MLIGLEIVDFESHKHSTFDFTAGVNLLWGDSDAGKSSIVRAIAVVAYNRWDEKMLRVGAKSSKIKLISDRGYVRVVRGGGKNEWEIKDEAEDKVYNYEKVGKTVPEVAIKILGMPQIEFGTVTDFPNVMFQLDKHYMISEIDGKKCSGNMVAQMIDGIFGLTGVEELINKISSEGLKSRKRLNENKEEIKNLESQLHSKQTLEDKEKQLEKCKNAYDNVLKLQESLTNLTDTFDLLEVANKNLSSINVKLNVYSNLEEIEKLYLKMRGTADILLRKSDSYDKFVSLTEGLDKANKGLLKLENIESLEGKLSIVKSDWSSWKSLTDELEKKEKADRQIKETMDKLNKLPDMLLLNSIYDNLRKGYETYSSLTSLNKELGDLSEGLDTKKRLMSDADKNLTLLQEEKAKFIESNPECPTCGQLLANSHLCKEQQ